MGKKAIVVLLVGLALVSVHSAEAQQAKKVPHIGYMRFIEVPVYDAAFRKELNELGYIDGQNIYIEYRFAGGSIERLAEFAAELVSLKVNVIVAGSRSTPPSGRPRRSLSSFR